MFITCDDDVSSHRSVLSDCEEVNEANDVRSAKIVGHAERVRYVEAVRSGRVYGGGAA
jgi:hypothetical protein